MPPTDVPSLGPIRVFAADVPDEFYQELAEAIKHQPDLQLLGRAQDRLELLLAVGQGVDVLLIGAAQVHPPPGICSHLLSEFPDIKILVLAFAGDRTMLYWRGLRRRQLARLSTLGLQAEIRSAYAIDPAQ